MMRVDMGIDLLAVKKSKHFGIQVKESRYYEIIKWRDWDRGHSWHRIHKRKFYRDKNKVQFYVFVTYIPSLW